MDIQGSFLAPDPSESNCCDLAIQGASVLGTDPDVDWIQVGSHRVEVFRFAECPDASPLDDPNRKAQTDRDSRLEAMLQNLLNRQGYKDLDSVLNQGAQRGIERILSALLGNRFGQLPEWAKTRLHAADIDTLERWSPRALDAERLEDVFD
jgi:hypothetical protein